MIRPYEEEDTEGVVEAWYQTSLIAHSFLSEPFFEEEKENLRNIFLPRAQTWVYEIEGRVGGFISLAGNEVGGIFIHPAWQRRGIGTALLDKAKSLQGVLELEVFEANTQGRSFYAKG